MTIFVEPNEKIMFEKSFGTNSNSSLTVIAIDGKHQKQMETPQSYGRILIMRQT